MNTRLYLPAILLLFWLPQSHTHAQITGTTGWNRVIVQEPRFPYTTLTGTESASLVPAVVSYSDGSGRTHQQVGVGQSPAGFGDLVQATTYDNLGRPDRMYLPFAPTGPATGQLQAVSPAQVSPFYGNDTQPFGQATYQANGVVDKQFGPGQAWRGSTPRALEDRDAVVPANTIRYWTLTGTGIEGTVQNGPNAVVLSTTTDEQGSQTRTYTDRDGRLWLKQVQDGPNSWQSTAYGYDDLDRLVVIIPPLLYDIIVAQGYQLSLSDPRFASLAFAYRYESGATPGKGRLVEQQTPGGGWSYLVYNRLGEVVMSQDARQRAINQWTITKYDVLGRVALRGTHSETTYDRATLQSQHDGRTQVVEQYVSKVAGSASYQQYATDYPLITEQTTDAVYFYDNYNWSSPGFTVPADPNSRNVQGQPTGQRSRILGTNTWLYAATYYDDLARPTHTVNTHVLGAANESRIFYNFTNQVTQTQTTYRQPAKPDLTVTTRYDYDQTGHRTLAYHKIGNQTEQPLAAYQYDAVGRLVQKKIQPQLPGLISQQSGTWPVGSTWQSGNVPGIGSTATLDAGHTVTIPDNQLVFGGKLIFSTDSKLVFQPGSRLFLNGGNTGGPTLQTIDYQYDVRGALRAINGDASGDPALSTAQKDLFALKLDYHQDERLYNGLLSRQTWQTSGGSPARNYQYFYDYPYRLLFAFYSGSGSEAFNVATSYDRNGNLTGLTRQGLTASSTGGRYGTPTSFGNTDQLSYAYSGNQLQTVADNAANGLSVNPVDYRGVGNYAYHADGSLANATNKGISQIEYNQFGLPYSIGFYSGNSITISYDGTGNRLSRTITPNGTTPKTIVYLGSARYENGVLTQLSTDEGRAVSDSNNPGQFVYEYHYSDFKLVNLVVPGLSGSKATYQLSHDYPRPPALATRA